MQTHTYTQPTLSLTGKDEHTPMPSVGLFLTVASLAVAYTGRLDVAVFAVAGFIGLLEQGGHADMTRFERSGYADVSRMLEY